MPPAPAKLKHDAIVEAVLEIQFEHSQLAEVVVGKLMGSAYWAGHQVSRLPLGDFPTTVREAEANLRFQPYMQMEREEVGETVRVGGRVISLHVKKPYPGWTAFFPRLRELIAALFEAIGEPHIQRVGLRYVNALTPEHGFDSFWDMNVDFSVAGQRPMQKQILVYSLPGGENVSVLMKVASPGFVENSDVKDAVAFVDADVSTDDPMGQVPVEHLEKWVECAHEAAKNAFFALWHQKQIDAMAE